MIRNFAILSTLLLIGLPAHAAAPFPQAFHGLSVSTLKANSTYYPRLGLHPQTLSIYYTTVNTHGLLTAGSFDDVADKNSRFNIRIYSDDIVDLFKQYAPLGLIPREISATNSGEIPTFNVIWEKSPVEAALYVDMSDAGFDARYKEYVVNQGYRISQHVTYTTRVGNRPRQMWHMAVFKKDRKGFYFHHGIDIPTFRNLATHYASLGYYPDSISFTPMTEGERISVIFLRPSARTIASPDMTAAGYQDQFDRMVRAGFRLHQVVGYHRGERFAAIWQKQ